MKEKGQADRVKCKRCGRIMIKWKRPQEDEIAYPFPFDKVCGFCITEEDINFYKITGGLTMAHSKKITGTFTYNSESKKYNKFIFETPEGVVGNIFIPKNVREIPSQIILHSKMKAREEE